jgi:hypothetical protein
LIIIISTLFRLQPDGFDGLKQARVSLTLDNLAKDLAKVSNILAELCGIAW